VSNTELAAALATAERERRPIAPLTETAPGLTVEDAYAIQSENVAHRVRDGAILLGRKVGLTSKPMQELLGVSEPDFGALLDDMFVEEGDAIRLDTLIEPRVEAEIAFVLGADLRGPGVTTTAALRAIGAAVPALEIIDSRVEGWKIKLIDTVADNASSARVVLGGKLTPLDGLDLRLVGAVVSVDGEVVDTAAGAAVLGHPARCVAWLANKLGELGDGLREGDVVLAGALHRALPLPGDRGTTVRAEFSTLGSVTARFEARA
jgi:2-oxopent-4-enoate hydratase